MRPALRFLVSVRVLGQTQRRAVTVASALLSVVLSVLLVLGARPLVAQERDTASPPHRRHHALTYDPIGRRVLLYGGQHLVSNSEAPFLADLWSWNGTRWTQLAVNTGMSIIAHKVYAEAGEIFVTANRYGVTSRFDGQRWALVRADSLTRREMASGAYDPQRKRFVLFGGHIDGRSFPRDTWEFDGQQWRRAIADGPPARLGGAMAFDAHRRVMVMFGGLDSAGRKLGDTWEWDGAHWTRVAIRGGPSPRFGAGIAYDVARRETVLFGGADSTSQKLSDTWRWDGRSWRRADMPNAPSANAPSANAPSANAPSANAPRARSEGYMAFDESRGVIVMFGGEGAQTIPTLNDTWEWNGVRWTKVR